MSELKLWRMNDDYRHIVAAKTKEEAIEHFIGTFDGEAQDLLEEPVEAEEVNLDEVAVFEELGEMTYGDFLKQISMGGDNPRIVAWKE